MRRISWVRAAEKEFLTFPEPVQDQIKFALEIAASGQLADTAKPMKGLDGGIYEIALPHRGDAYRAIYASRSEMSFGWCTRSKRSRRKASKRRNARSTSFGND